MKSHAIIVFGKNPIPGQVKTRLARSIGADAAATLYTAFLLDSLNAYQAVDATIRLYLAPTDIPSAKSLGKWRDQVLFQKGRDLGARMSQAFAETFGEGFSAVVIVGSDHPTLPPRAIREALDHLDSLDSRRVAVIGPTDDGGYCLLGLSDPWPDLFKEIEYGSPDVLSKTLGRVAESGGQAVLLDPWYDVDDIDDLTRLIEDLRLGDSGCVRTRSVLEELDLI